jgi:hypothetical protein
VLTNERAETTGSGMAEAEVEKKVANLEWQLRLLEPRMKAE